MLSFLIKGLIRDKSRFLIPLLVVMGGAALTVMMAGYIRGWIIGMIDTNACLDTGHVKVMTRPYAERKNQHPNELALLEADVLIEQLEKDYPGWTWKKRIYFGGIIDTTTEDVPGKQGPVSALAFDFSNLDCEVSIFKFQNAMTGTLPETINHVAIGEALSEKLSLNIGDGFVFLGSTMHGGISFEFLKISSIISFGMAAFDHATILVDLDTAEAILDMEGAAGEILGFAPGGYRLSEVKKITADFNARHDPEQFGDRFSPIMLGLEEQNQLEELIAYYESVTTIFIAIFVLAMSLVMWNTGLISGIRRYREFGIRLALGESKSTLYGFLILESTLIGFIGSCLGTLIGLGFTYYLKQVGIDISSLLQDSSALIPTEIRGEFTFSQLYIGFIPGLFSVVLGNMLAGVGIFKRQTALLLKELEV